MSELYEIKLSLARVENNLHMVMGIANFRHFQTAKSYLDDEEIVAGLQYLNNIENLSMNAKTIVAEGLFLRGLILCHELKFTEALALLIRIRKFEDIKYMGTLAKDLEKIITAIKTQKNLNSYSNSPANDEKIRDFQDIIINLIYSYLEDAQNLLAS